ncbi:conserved hypothetical protein [Roseibium sp. TrichSKD4]|uniref:sensor histidine kinase n=1 Tax=Roseibium sp. TrichSKD4 TaxID=744980 RepID=UPI0001E56F34|nr:ATP-binding protein [Roseibium sp. TrichSKD4]EFO31311.1 conserved hypothetical protein [Roseibium sp. TrichSKD4]
MKKLRENSQLIFGVIGAFLFGLLVLILITSEYDRRNMSFYLNRNIEIQWRIAQIKERLIHVLYSNIGMSFDERFEREAQFFIASIRQMNSLGYLSDYFEPADIKHLQEIERSAEIWVNPGKTRATSERVYSEIEKTLKYLNRLSSISVENRQEIQIEANTRANYKIKVGVFVVTIILLYVFYILIYQRYVLVLNHNKRIRDFVSLFVHMTRTRIAGLRLFFDGQPSSAGCVQDDALNTIGELEKINAALLKMTSYQPEYSTGLLMDVLESIPKRDVIIKTETNITHFYVNVDVLKAVILEVVQNALDATRDEVSPEIIVIVGRAYRRFYIGRYMVPIVVKDNGMGMDDDIKSKAVLPFFSIKGGSHTGLGLSGSIGMMSAIGGRLSIESERGIGTQVTLNVPVSLKGHSQID